MAGITQVEFAQLEAGATDLDQVAADLKVVCDDLKNALDREGQSWGTDKPGSTHASGYDEQSQGNLDATEAKVQKMLNHVDTIRSVAKAFVAENDSQREALTWKA